ncbi:MAG: spore maturation protein [Ignavibacteriaceae bacterium]|nr:spore maturation protein [Ignavibacteria bacterium]NNJ53516.1 spore maturation protein [Ignavibacteriaceae bacterium]NNL19918.1 spore maturation protein [Ignavibacteriaceae bacterium]
MALNYIWLGLLLLGVGAALTTDIIDQSSDKYRNNIPIELFISVEENSNELSDGNNNVKVNVMADEFNTTYNDSINLDITSDAVLLYSREKQVGTIIIKGNGRFPSLWKEMARASGEEDDLLGQIKLIQRNADNSYKAEIVFEQISFAKMKTLTDAALDYAGTAVTIAFGLIGIMALWLGVMKVAEEAGLIKIIANALKPITKRLFPEIPSDHPAMSSMIMNISANMLGLGNAATPFGLKAMEEMEKINPNKGTATNSMVTFLAINTAGLTLIPATAIAVRAASGSSNPAIIIGTSIFGAFCATVAGVSAAKIIEKFYLKSWSFVAWLKKNIKIILSLILFIIAVVLVFATGLFNQIASIISPSGFRSIIEVISALAIPLLILIFIGYGAIKKVKVYESFVEGAKDGFTIAVKIIPYLVAMLVAIGIFRAGGAMEWLIYILSPITSFIGFPADALPMALMRPLSGSGSLGIMSENLAVYGPDSFVGVLVSTFYGSTETTFYVLAVYFGSVNIKNTRHALPVGLIADVAGILGALFIVRLLFSA